MLDDLKYIHEKDPQDALGIADKEWEQLVYDFELTPEFKTDRIDNVVYSGMGGSALGALIAQTWPTLPKPFEIVRNYDIPGYVDKNTLFIASSYSGNTEETLSALEKAGSKGAQIVVMAGGGKLVEVAKEHNYPLALLPSASQPRFAVFYSLKAFVALLISAGMLDAIDAEKQLKQASEFIRESVKVWSPIIPTANNQAKQIALECIGKSVVIYGGPKLYPAAYKWKISFNENAKQVAWVNQLPECNHNEFVGWSKQPVDKPYTVIDLRSSLENPRVLKRFEVTERLLSGMRPEPIVVQPQGESLLEQLLWTIVLGDFVTLYTAILNGINPSPVDLVEKFKQELAK
jgi:glucose/mannose-6-phosphate isomerase